MGDLQLFLTSTSGSLPSSSKPEGYPDYIVTIYHININRVLVVKVADLGQQVKAVLLAYQERMDSPVNIINIRYKKLFLIALLCIGEKGSPG